MRRIFLVVGVVVFGLGLSACAGSPTAPSSSTGSFTSRGVGAARGNQPNDNNGQNGNHYGQEKNGNNGNHNGQDKNGNNKDGEKHEEVPPAETTPEIPPITTTPDDPSGSTQPALSVSALTVAAGESVTVRLTNGRGGTYDWLALAPTGSENTSYYGQWTYIGAGVTTFNWTVTMPTTAGNYEFRLFLNGDYTLAATSPSVAVTVPVPTLSVSAVNVAGGASVTVTLTNGIGGTYDWLALAPAGASDGTYLQWTYIGAGVTTFPWTIAMPTAAGTYEFRLFLNGFYTRAATSPTITVN